MFPKPVVMKLFGLLYWLFLIGLIVVWWWWWCGQLLLSHWGQLREPLQNSFEVSMHHLFCYFTMIKFPVVPWVCWAHLNLKMKTQYNVNIWLCLVKVQIFTDYIRISETHLSGLLYLPWQNICWMTNRLGRCSLGFSSSSIQMLPVCPSTAGGKKNTN